MLPGLAGGQSHHRGRAPGPGAPRVGRVTLSERQPKLGIGPLRQTAVRTGAARFTVARAPLGAPGTWSITVTVLPAGGGAARPATFPARLR